MNAGHDVVATTLSEWLVGLPGERIEALGLAPAPGWWRQREHGVGWRGMPAAALAGYGPDGVLMADGQYTFGARWHTDLWGVGPRAPAMRRRYDSRQMAEDGLLGPGWRLPWEMQLCDLGEQLCYLDAWGRRLSLPKPAPGHLVVVADESLRLACLSDGSYLLADLSPSYWHFGAFDGNGVARPISHSAADGHRIELRRDAAGRLLALCDTNGQQLRLQCDDTGRLRTVSRGTGAQAVLRFDYDVQGCLSLVERAGQPPAHYAYQEGRLSRVEDAMGVRMLRWTHDGGVIHLADLTLPDGATWSWRPLSQRRQAWLRTADGADACWQFDGEGRVSVYQDPAGASFQIERDSAGRACRIEGPEGCLGLRYDDFGRVVEENWPDGTSRRIAYSGATRLPVMLALSPGRSWFWDRDAALRSGRRRINGQPPLFETQQTLPDGGCRRWLRQGEGVTFREYDALGRLLREAVPGGGWRRYQWAEDGTLTRRDGPDGQRCQAWGDSDADGARGWLLGSGPSARLLRCDAAGRWLSVTDGLGQTQAWRYDSQGRLISRTDAETSVTHFDWAAKDAQLVVRGPGDAWQYWWHRPAQGISARRDADGVLSEQHIDDSGRLCWTRRSAAGATLALLYERDADGRVLACDSKAVRRLFAYDEDRRLIGVTDAGQGEAAEVGLSYDPAGRVIAERSGVEVLGLDLDTSGRVTRWQLPDGLVLCCASSADGLRTQLGYVHEGTPVALIALVFDADGRECLRQAGALRWRSGADGTTGLAWRSLEGDAPVQTQAALRWRLRYDAAGRLLEWVWGDGRWLYDYDRCGQLIRALSETGAWYMRWDGGGNLTDMAPWGWPAAAPSPDHRVASVADAQLSYDEWGRILGRRQRRGEAVFEWDELDRLRCARIDGMQAYYEYDAAGRLVRRRACLDGCDHEHSLYWDGPRLLQESTLRWRATYLYAPAPAGFLSFEPLARLIQRRAHARAPWSVPEVECLFADAAGCVQVATDMQGNLRWRRDASPWGRWRAPLDPAMTMGFAGQWHDPLTQLCWQAGRFYDPLLGRYLSPAWSVIPGRSPYRYVGAPVMQANPLGRADGEAGGAVCTAPAPLDWVRALVPPIWPPLGGHGPSFGHPHLA